MARMFLLLELYDSCGPSERQRKIQKQQLFLLLHSVTTRGYRVLTHVQINHHYLCMWFLVSMGHILIYTHIHTYLFLYKSYVDLYMYFLLYIYIHVYYYIHILLYIYICCIS